MYFAMGYLDFGDEAAITFPQFLNCSALPRHLSHHAKPSGSDSKKRRPSTRGTRACWSYRGEHVIILVLSARQEKRQGQKGNVTEDGRDVRNACLR